MKHIKTFESYSVNEELLGGIAVIATIGAVLASGAIYDGIKKGYSKYITGRKYDKTGKEVKVNSEGLKTQVIYEYEDKEGNKYWGWDHQYNPDLGNHLASLDVEIPTGDVYTGIFKYEDLDKLKKFVVEFPNYRNRPEPVDMIYSKNIDHLIGRYD